MAATTDASSTTNGKGTAPSTAPTKYVILEAIKLPGTTPGLKDLLPGGMHQDKDGQVTLWLPLRNEKTEHGKDGEVRIVESASGKETAIKAATKLDEEDAQRPGSYKGVPLQSWRGGKRYKNRETVVTDSEDLED